MARASGITRLQLRHVLADPRSRAALAASVDVGAATAALVVSDMRWRSGGGGGGGEDPPGAGGDVSGGGGDTDLTTRVGPDAVSQPDALRMDAAVLAVQLNIRILLEVGGSKGEAAKPPGRGCWQGGGDEGACKLPACGRAPCQWCLAAEETSGRRGHLQ